MKANKVAHLCRYAQKLLARPVAAPFLFIFGIVLSQLGYGYLQRGSFQYSPLGGSTQIISPTSSPTMYWTFSAGMLGVGVLLLVLSAYAAFCLFRACCVDSGASVQAPMSETEPPKSKAEFLRAELKKHIKTFCEDRQSNKRKAFHLKIWGTVFSAITTILLGLQGFDHWTTYLKNSALALSAFVTVFTAWDAFFNHRALWIHYKSIQMELEAVLAELDYLLADSNSSPKSQNVDALFRKYQQVLEHSTQSWLGLRRPDSGDRPKKDA